MGKIKQSLLLFAALLLGVSGTSIINIKQVLLDQQLCGETLNLSLPSYDAVRLFASDDRPCTEGVFRCEVTIQTTFLPAETDLCVDFSRMRPNGPYTMLSVYEGYTRRRFTEQFNSYTRSYVASTLCRKVESVRLLFQYACDRNLSEAFPSWMYFYLQQKDKPVIYYVDGTCDHRLKLGYPAEVFVRSVLWGNTVGEPDVQKCTLEIDFTFVEDDEIKFCPAWNFTGGCVICGSYVGWLETGYFFSLEEPWHTVATCVDKNIDALSRCRTGQYGSWMKLRVTRDRRIEQEGDEEGPRDQHMFTMTLQVERPQKRDTDSYAKWDSSDDFDTTHSSESDLDAFESMGPITKLFLGLSAMAAFFCCMCSIAKRLSTKSSTEAAPAVETNSEQQSERFIPHRDPYTYQERAGMPRTVPQLPRHLDQQNRRPRVTVNDYRRSQEDLAALRHANSGLLQESESSRAGNSTPRRERSAPPSPLPPRNTENAPPSYEDVAMPAAPPPAYTDLFPTRNSVQ